MNIAIIKVPSDGIGIDIQSNGVSYITILNALKAIERAVAQQLVQEAKKVVGNDPKAIEKYLDQLIHKNIDGEGNNFVFNLN